MLVTGATGFLGEHTVPRLLRDAGEPVAVLVRPSSTLGHLEDLGVEVRVGDLRQPATIERALHGVDTLVNLASLAFGATPALVGACLDAGVRRALFVGTTAMFTTLDAPSKAVRQQAEHAITGSALNYTILRPTMIYGTPRDANMSRLVRVLRRTPVFPVLGSGAYLQQPVHVDDVADAVTTALRCPAATQRTYNLSGAQPLTFNAVVDTTARLLDRNVRRVHLPVRPALAALRVYQRRARRPVLRDEQVLRLNEHKDFDHCAATRDFGFGPRSFEEGVGAEIALMRREGHIALRSR